jgi:hypothetical protein
MLKYWKKHMDKINLLFLIHQWIIPQTNMSLAYMSQLMEGAPHYIIQSQFI